MRKLSRPEVTGIHALKLCASSVKDSDIKNKLRLIENVVSAAEKNYVSLGESEQLYCIVGTDNIGGHLTSKQMQRVYNNTFVKSAKTRSIYDKLKKACENDICPLCGQGTVHQLDHYLPIANFPIYGLSSINLVPACSDCNKRKLAYVAAEASEQTLHPYFDDVEQERWLYARVLEVKPATLIFSVNPPQNWSVIKAERLMKHFKTFGLGALYATHAAVEINNMRFALTKMFTGLETAGRINAYLRERMESCASVHINSWQTATLDALTNSYWFCSGGFLKD